MEINQKKGKPAMEEELREKIINILSMHKLEEISCEESNLFDMIKFGFKGYDCMDDQELMEELTDYSSQAKMYE